MSIDIASLVKIPCYLLKLSSRNENMGVSRADNSVKIWRNLPISNPKPDLLNVNAYSVSRVDNSVKIWRNLPISNPKPHLHNINAHTKFGENPLIFTQVIIQKQKNGRMDRWTHRRPTWTIVWEGGIKILRWQQSRQNYPACKELIWPYALVTTAADNILKLYFFSFFWENKA